MSQRPVLIAVTSDQHSGSTLGLCPEEGVRLDDDGRFLPSKAQLWLWECWKDYWHKIEAVRRKAKADLWCVYNGDATDGDHHGTSQIISRNPEVQAYVTHRVFSVPRDLKPERSFMVRGTEDHVGPSGANEEALAKHLGCEKDPATDAHSSWFLPLVCHGRRWEFTHHASAGGLPWTRPGAIAKLAFLHRQARFEDGEPVADYIIQSHLHVHLDSYDTFKTRAMITPSFQLATAYVHRRVPLTYNALANVGGLGFLVQPDGEVAVSKFLYKPSLPAAR